MFANTCLCIGSVAPALTCEQLSIDWWRVGGFFCLTLSKDVNVAIVVILDVFTRSAHNDVRESIFR